MELGGAWWAVLTGGSGALVSAVIALFTYLRSSYDSRLKDAQAAHEERIAGIYKAHEARVVFLEKELERERTEGEREKQRLWELLVNGTVITAKAVSLAAAKDSTG